MTKKIIGICLLILGGVIILYSGYSLVKSLSTSKQEMVEQFKENIEKENVENLFSDEQIEEIMASGLMSGRIISLGLILIAAVFLFGGYKLYQRGKKDIELFEPFKFE